MEVPLLTPTRAAVNPGGRRRRPRSSTSGCGARSRRFPASSRWASARRCRSRSSDVSFEVKAEGKALAVGRGDAARRVAHREPGVLPRRGHSAAQGAGVRRDRSAGLRQGRDHQPDARRPALPGRGPDREADRVDGDVLRFTPDQRRLAHDRRRGRQHAGRRTGRGAAARGVHAASRRSSRSAAGW